MVTRKNLQGTHHDPKEPLWACGFPKSSEALQKFPKILKELVLLKFLRASTLLVLKILINQWSPLGPYNKRPRRALKGFVRHLRAS